MTMPGFPGHNLSAARTSGRQAHNALLPQTLIRLASIFACLLLLAGTALAQQYTIKFATLAPDGSTWMNVLKEYDQAIRKESGGRMGFRMYPGGVQGDEINVLRKIKLGQLHSAGITGNGMTTVAPEVRILDSPFLFRSYQEADTVLQLLDGEFTKAIQDGGYVLLGWAEVGFVYIFTNTPVRVPADMKRVKMWMWEGDPVAEAAFKALGIDPISLSITDVPTSLQTGLIDGIYTSPMAAIALQWFTRVKYMLDQPLAYASGATIISKKKFDELPPDLQEVLTRNGRLYMKKLTALTRQEAVRSVETLKKNGIQIIEPPSQDAVKQYEDLGDRARRLLVGKLYPQSLLSKVEATLQEIRKRQETRAK